MNQLPKCSNGFSMIELLIAVVILAVGLLGVAGIQSIGIRTANVALNHNTATQVAVEIIERMRTNPLAFKAGSYTGTYDETSPPAAVTCTTTCTVEEQAKKDLYQWYARVKQLNEGAAEIKVTGSKKETAEVTIRWTDVTFGGQTAATSGNPDPRTGEEAQSFTLSARMF